MPTTASIHWAPLFRDLAKGLNQQMYFWGLDAAHREGNLFVRFGFEKRPSIGLQGTSCYHLPWGNGGIELHGSHAGWIGGEGGMFFVRPMNRCIRWQGTEAPIPGKWHRDSMRTSSDENLFECTKPFLEWWKHHEECVARLLGASYRENCFRRFRKLPHSRTWLEPSLATMWIEEICKNAHNAPRAGKFPARSRR